MSSLHLPPPTPTAPPTPPAVIARGPFRRDGALAQACRLARPFWTDPAQRGRAWLLLAAIVALTLGMVWVNVALNTWQGEFYNALQAKDAPAFWRLMLKFSGIAALFIGAAVYRLYLNQWLVIRWREWMTKRLTAAWLNDHAHYRLQLAGALDPRWRDNPDQRIADDVSGFVGDSLSLSLGLLNAVVTLVSFAGILWALSGALPLHLGGMSWSIPGYLVWVALLYAALGSWLTLRVGRPLTTLNAEQQRVEADFRFGLARLREHGEAIALQRGEPAEARASAGRFMAVAGNWIAIMRRQKRLTALTAAYGQVATVFPYLAAAPRYFAGGLTLGALMQSASAFGQVQGALSWFVDAFGSLASWRATVARLADFEAVLSASHGPAASAGSEQPAAPALRRHAHANRIELHDLHLTLPDGRPVDAPSELVLEPGESLLIEGPSGIGKSTLLRALAGVWPHGRGDIHVPADGLLFVPQKAYLPVGSLRDALAYPAAGETLGDAQAKRLLEEVGLASLAPELDHVDRWSHRLSLGEQQRIGFAHVLRAAPRWVFLDEATSALDTASEATLYRLLRRELPGAAIVSIGHRASLRAFHDRRLTLGATPFHGPGSARFA